MPEGSVGEDLQVQNDSSKKTKNGKDSQLKKSATANGFSSFARGKLVLARVNMLDGSVNDLSIEVRLLSISFFLV